MYTCTCDNMCWVFLGTNICSMFVFKHLWYSYYVHEANGIWYPGRLNIITCLSNIKFSLYTSQVSMKPNQSILTKMVKCIQLYNCASILLHFILPSIQLNKIITENSDLRKSSATPESTTSKSPTSPTFPPVPVPQQDNLPSPSTQTISEIQSMYAYSEVNKKVSSHTKNISASNYKDLSVFKRVNNANYRKLH